MIVDKELLTLSDGVKLCETSNSNVPDRRTSDKKLPETYEQTSADQIRKTDDVGTNSQQKKEPDRISTGNLKTKRIAVIGRARGGKSFLTSRLVQDRKGFHKLFCGNGSDKTVCPVYVNISDTNTSEQFIFHSDFNSLCTDKDKQEISGISELRSRVNALSDKEYSHDDIEKMHEIEEVIREIRSFEKKYPDRKKSSTHIDTYQKPSDFSKELLRECGLSSIEIVDTPGVSGKVEASHIAKSDIYVFLVKPDNGDEAQTLKRIVTELKAEIATSKVVFLYKIEGFFSSATKYDEARESVKKDMAAYSELFSDLKGSIVSTELDVLDPASHCIPFPTMDAEDKSTSEDEFLSDLKAKLVDAFKPEDPCIYDQAFKELIAGEGEPAKDFALHIMHTIPKHKLFDGKKEYTHEDVTKENHNRVMSKDNYRIKKALDEAYRLESNLLDQFFSKFVVEDYPEGWQHKVIKFIYKEITRSVRTDRGLGVGRHSREECPARTMLVEESIFADTVLNRIAGKDDGVRNVAYITALRNNNVSSASWDYVGCINGLEAIRKLQIIKNCLLKVKVSNIGEMVLCRYVGGLRKEAQYRILRLLGYAEKSSMDELDRLPF